MLRLVQKISENPNKTRLLFQTARLEGKGKTLSLFEGVLLGQLAWSLTEGALVMMCVNRQTTIQPIRVHQSYIVYIPGRTLRYVGDLR